MAYRIDPDARYTESHEWVRREGNAMVIGITDYAQHALSDVVYVELPHAGDRVAKGESLGTFESVKAAEEVYSPLSGTISAVNDELADHPERVNEDPFGADWLASIVPDHPAEFASLLDAAAYQALLENAA